MPYGVVGSIQIDHRESRIIHCRHQALDFGTDWAFVEHQLMSPSRELVGAGQLTVILGLCGSGKSWLLERLEVEVKSPHDGFATDRRHLTSIVEALRQGKSCAVIEIAYCNPNDRAAFERELRSMIPEVRITYICFENDLQKANANCRRRNDGRDVQMLLNINTAVSAYYTMPPGADVRSIWTPE